MSNSNGGNWFENLTDQLVERILETSDQEILQEIDEEGISQKDLENSFKSDLEVAKMKVGRERLEKARTEMLSQKQKLTNIPIKTPAEARALIEQASREFPELTQAARNANSGQASEKDIQQQYADLVELGLIKDES